MNTVYISSIDRFEFHRDPDLVKRIGAATAVEVRATGIPYTFAPCIAVNFLYFRSYKFSPSAKVYKSVTLHIFSTLDIC